MRLTDEITDCVMNTSYDQIPYEAIEIAKRCVLDTIGVALAGCKEPASKILIDYVREHGGNGEASLIGCDLRATATDAALANGTISHALDYDDNTWAYIGHPSAVILPAVLTLGEKVRASGKELLCSFIVGFEAACRIGSLATPLLSEIGWHTTSVVGVYGAAAAAGKILKLNRQEIAYAMGIATSESSGVKANFGTMTKSFHAGKAACDGVTAALLAQKGLTSADDALEHRYGFLKVFAKRAMIRSKRGRWGNPFAIVNPGVTFKKYPSCTGTHPAIDAVLSLVDEHDIYPQDVQSISCGTTPDVPKEVFYSTPRTGLEGKFSMPFCLSLALSERTALLAQFSDEYVNKPAIKELMKKCSIYVEAKLTKKQGIFSPAGIVEIKLKDGKRYSRRVDLAKGNPENPLSQEELIGKFKDCAMTRLPVGKVDCLLETIMHLEEIEDVTKLMDLTG